MQLKPDTTLQGGKFRILRVLGQGGFGITYLAEDKRLGRKVAIKEFFPKEFCGRANTNSVRVGTETNRGLINILKAKFLKEVRNIAQLNHPGIVKIHDVIEENDTAYYVMEYIEGINLNEKIKRDGPLSTGKALKYISKVGNAVGYIHSKNMTHFDIKPANIIVRDSDDEPILIDFGLSKQYNPSGEADSTIIPGVSPGYSPMELYNVENLLSFSPQSDIYSLAATLYYLLSGDVPPHAVALLDEELKFASQFPTKIQESIKWGMSPMRKVRTQNIADFLQSLQQPQEETRLLVETVNAKTEGSNGSQAGNSSALPNSNSGNSGTNNNHNGNGGGNGNNLDTNDEDKPALPFWILGIVILVTIAVVFFVSFPFGGQDIDYWDTATPDTAVEAMNDADLDAAIATEVDSYAEEATAPAYYEGPIVEEAFAEAPADTVAF